MKDEDSHPNEFDASLENIQIEITSVPDPEDVDQEDVDALEARIEEIEEIDFSETIPPQRELLAFELSNLKAALEAYHEVLGGDDDV